MAVKDVKSTAAHIKQGDIAGVYYFYGADIVQTEALTKQLIRKATGGNETMALTKYDGKNLDLDELASSAELFPMMSEYNCIWIHDLNAESCREDQLKKLMEIISDTGDQTVIVFSVTGFDVKDGKKTPTPKNKKLIDKIAKLGTVCEAVQRTFPEIAKSLMSAAQRRGCILQRKEAEFLTARCMGNTVQLQSELEKLCAYANGGEITEKMIESLVSPAIETTVYALAKAVIALRPAQAMAELDRLYSMRTSRTFIVHAVASGFIDLYRAAVAWRNGHSPEEMQKDFGYRFDFVVKNAFRDCRKIAPERLRACISVLRDLEQKLNSSSADERVLLESAIVKMLEIASGRMEISI
jgi:DNA polymerase-3 subunit delta